VPIRWELDIHAALADVIHQPHGLLRRRVDVVKDRLHFLGDFPGLTAFQDSQRVGRVHAIAAARFRDEHDALFSRIDRLERGKPTSFEISEICQVAGSCPLSAVWCMPPEVKNCNLVADGFASPQRIRVGARSHHAG